MESSGCETAQDGIRCPEHTASGCRVVSPRGRAGCACRQCTFIEMIWFRANAVDTPVERPVCRPAVRRFRSISIAGRHSLPYVTTAQTMLLALAPVTDSRMWLHTLGNTIALQ